MMEVAVAAAPADEDGGEEGAEEDDEEAAAAAAAEKAAAEWAAAKAKAEAGPELVTLETRSSPRFSVALSTIPPTASTT